MRSDVRVRDPGAKPFFLAQRTRHGWHEQGRPYHGAGERLQPLAVHRMGGPSTNFMALYSGGIGLPVIEKQARIVSRMGGGRKIEHRAWRDHPECRPRRNRSRGCLDQRIGHRAPGKARTGPFGGRPRFSGAPPGAKRLRAQRQGPIGRAPLPGSAHGRRGPDVITGLDDRRIGWKAVHVRCRQRESARGSPPRYRARIFLKIQF